MADKIRLNSKYDIKENYEPSDSEDEYSHSDRKILDKFQSKRQYDSDPEEDMYAFSESDDDSEKKEDDFGIADSDVEGQEDSEDDLPNSRAWGKKKKAYYAADYVDQDYGGFGEDEEDALMEEEEAKNIQKRLLEQLGEEDFSLDFINKQIKSSEEQETVIKSDLTQLSKRQKIQLLDKESPEFAGLIEDFKTKLIVAKDDMHPLLKLVKDGKVPKCPASKFIRTNFDVILNYCTNITFYLLLKSQKVNIQNHPVIKRLYQYRQILSKMEPIYQNVVKPQIDKILSAVKTNIELKVTDSLLDNNKRNEKRKLEHNTSVESSAKKLKFINTLEKDDYEDTGVSDNDDDDIQGTDVFNAHVEKNQTNIDTESEESGFSDNEVDSSHDLKDNIKPSVSSESQSLLTDDIADKREITYQIAKNKGLTPHRKREQRNPRVKHKLKYRKAKIRRKGAIREPRKEITRYGGEASGIKANVKKSIKIK